MKTCSNTQCSQVNPQGLNNFYFRKDSKKYRLVCKTCFCEERKEPNKEYKQKDIYKKWKKEYDLSYHADPKGYYKRYQKEYSKTPEYKNSQFSYNLRQYWPGLSSKEAKQIYESILIKQNGNCAICKNPETKIRNGKSVNLSVDHCHKTGIVRGLLCNKCNRTLGVFYDDIEFLKEAIKYLEKGRKNDIFFK